MTPPSNAGGEGREVLARLNVAQALYQLAPTVYHDRVDGDCEMCWQEATERRTCEYRDALRSADTAIAAMLAFGTRENADDRTDYTYDVTWSRADGERLTCRDLSPRLVTARIIQAIKTSGPITIHAVEGRADDRAPALVEAAVAGGGA